MDGTGLKAMRESRGETQAEFAAFLNARLGRKYDKGKISRWESGAERIPQAVAEVLDPPKVRRRKETATVLALANQKGGVAKTTATVNIAFALTQSDKRVLLVDADPQASATVHLGINQVEVTERATTLHDVLRGRTEAAKATVAVCDGRFRLLPSSIVLSAAEAELASEPMNWMLLKEKLAPILHDYDYILIDCPPNLSLMTQNALVASDWVLIPVQCEVLAMLGVPMLLDSIAKIRRRGNPDLAVLGLLPTMYNAHHTQDRATLEELTQRFGPTLRLFTPVVRSTVFPQSVAAGKVAMEVADEAKVEPFREVARALLEADEVPVDDVLPAPPPGPDASPTRPPRPPEIRRPAEVEHAGP